MNKRQTQILVAAFLAISIMTSTVLAASGSDTQVSGSFGTIFDQVFATPPAITLGDMFGSAMVATPAIPSVKANKPAYQEYTVTLTCYTSEPNQTDASPFIAADNTHVYDGMIATNEFAFKTAMKFPSVFGDKIFVVHDRMNHRFDRSKSGKIYIDVWFADKDACLKHFGSRQSITALVIK